MLSYRERRRIVEENAAYAKANSKSEKQGLWGLLNQPFALWLLSALVLSLWSTYHTAAQQCHEQADKTFADFVSLLDELGGRLTELRNQMEKSPEPDNPEIKKIYNGQLGYQSPYFRNYTLFAVLRSYNRLASRIILADNSERRRDNTFKMGLDTLGDPSYAIYPKKEYIDNDLQTIRGRRLAVEFGERNQLCSISTLFEILWYGYSDKPQYRMIPMINPWTPDEVRSFPKDGTGRGKCRRC
jgi:hypothetical protein